MVEQVDTRDLKSREPQSSCGFDSRSWYLRLKQEQTSANKSLKFREFGAFLFPSFPLLSLGIAFLVSHLSPVSPFSYIGIQKETIQDHEYHLAQKAAQRRQKGKSLP